jgi:hypothetical protein
MMNNDMQLSRTLIGVLSLSLVSTLSNAFPSQQMYILTSNYLSHSSLGSRHLHSFSYPSYNPPLSTFQRWRFRPIPSRNRPVLYYDLDSAESYPEGEDLAHELYEVVKLREFRAKLAEDERKENMKTEEAEKRALNSKPFSYRKEVRMGKDVVGSSSPSAFSPSSGGNSNNRNGGNGPNLFTMGPDNSLFTSTPSGGRYDASAEMMRQEFNLLETSSSEQTILAQAGFVFLLLMFYLFVGIRGGITDGSDRVFEDAMTTDMDVFLDAVEDLGSALDDGMTNTDNVWL